jgi:hypothetical protein
MPSPQRTHPPRPSLARTGLAVAAAAGLTLTILSCNSENPTATSGRADHGTPGTSTDGPLLSSALQSRADSVLAVRRVARTLAMSLADPKVRAGFFRAFRESRVPEGKLQMQRFLRGRGALLARGVEQLNHLRSGELDNALRSVEDLELYLPVPQDRANWQGTADVLVAGFIETDAQLRQGSGLVIAYDIQGAEVTIPYNAPTSRPVIVLTNTETAYAADGESSPSAMASKSVTPNLIQCPPGDPYCNPCPTCPPPPPPPPDPCASVPSATNLYVCRTSIPNVSQYEGLLRGSPEVSMLLFSVPPGGTGMATIGCINEDRTGASFYNQDNDNWTGSALIGNRPAVDQARAAGRGVLMLVWEDDNGSKCSFQTSNATKRKIFTFLDRLGALISLGWLTCAANDQCRTPPLPVFLASLAVAALSEIILGNDDDLIGAVALNAGADPFTNPRAILYTESSTSAPQKRGTVSFVTK